MSKQTIYNILAAKSEPVKIEFFAIDEADQAAAYLEEIATDLIALKKSMQTNMRKIESMTQDGIEQFKDLLAATAEIEKLAKQLGVDPSSVQQYKIADAALEKWTQANSMKI